MNVAIMPFSTAKFVYNQMRRYLLLDKQKGSHKYARLSSTCFSAFCLLSTSAHAYQAHVLVIFVY